MPVPNDYGVPGVVDKSMDTVGIARNWLKVQPPSTKASVQVLLDDSFNRGYKLGFENRETTSDLPF